jgi:hypothetical protein
MDLKEASSLLPDHHRHPWELARFRVLQDFMRGQVVKSDSFTVLDIGCGDLFVAREILALYRFATVVGIDTGLTEEQCASFTSDRIMVFNSIRSAENSIRNKVRFVLLMDVIEHVRDDRSLLKEAAHIQLVDENTLYIITVPAFGRLFTSHDVFLGHYRRYTRKRLNDLVFDSGLFPVRSGYFFFSLLIPRLIGKISERFFGKVSHGTGLTGWRGGKTTSAMLASFLLADYYAGKIGRALGIGLPGLSVFALCRKSR